ncbi:site-specific DNA-methyltransferase [Limnobaculum zhutongyuii]|uniref:Site-specific DNA-methyltransferase n=1 Tax=Limnobaculum zhutongyuii TaxID=2498113 RepID=A0A411WM33_9GAMM|nr:site-specific DNA-methyltransferase [Limnobaculum zhutongyuii]QBH97175.1 site-specific DNA-methyltransferase [Limnobaculum zhutongyuii]TQS88434.1 site-specific DNA-methyltransferase [Limnobaculum zhutongyuii]
MISVPHNELVAEYADLKQQYEDLRRPFSVRKEVPHTDVWHYPPVQYYPGKHPCEKPLEMMIDIINASSRPGEVVADFFLGGGNSLLAAKQTGRKGVGVELEAERFESTVEKLKNA